MPGPAGGTRPPPPSGSSAWPAGVSAPLPRAGSLSPPPSGSVRYFLLLYTPRERRAALATLLAIADELGAGLSRQLDHQVAHLRLQWWRQEAERAAQGCAVHPWLLELQRAGGPPIELSTLVEATAIDLASAHLRAQSAEQLPRTCFVLAAQLLAGRSPTTAPRERQPHELREQLESLGGWVAQLERLAMSRSPALTSIGAGSEPAAPLEPPPPLESTLIAPALQPPLAPLLVWAALALQRARRRVRRTAGAATRGSATMGDSRFDELADNFIAWRAARRAARSQYRIAAP